MAELRRARGGRPGGARGDRGCGARPAARAPRRSAPRLLAAGLALALAAIGLGVMALTGGDERPVVPPSGGQVVAIDASTGRVTSRLAAGRTPTALA